MRLGLDLDSTISSAPKLFRKLAKAVRKKGGKVAVITGHGTSTASPAPTAADYESAKKMLKKFKFPYDILYLAPHPHPENKAAFCKATGIDLCIDNTPANVAAVSRVTHAARFYPHSK